MQSKSSKKKKVNVTKEQTKELCVHFNTKEHRITLEEFTQTVNSYETIANNLAENLFNVKSGIKIYILPPKSGTFELNMLLWLGATAAAGIVGNIASDAIKGFIKGATKKLNLKNFPEGLEIEQGAEILGETVTGFMLETAEEINSLEKLLPAKINIDTAIKAKADFYARCSKSKEINGIGFSPKKEFPIKRCDFTERATPPKIKHLPEKQELKELIIVKSVNTDESLQWDFKDENTKESFSAKIEDEKFNSLLLSGKSPLKQKATPDIILALVEFKKKLENGKEKKDEYIVKEVYKFNSKKLKIRPKGLRLNKPKKDNNGQLNLFDNKESKTSKK